MLDIVRRSMMVNIIIIIIFMQKQSFLGTMYYIFYLSVTL